MFFNETVFQNAEAEYLVMCGKYGKAAIETTKKIQKSKTNCDPVEIWEQTIGTDDKSCPRCAFLGLCEDGWVKGVPRGNYVHPRNGEKRSKNHAVRAVLKIIEDPSLANDNPGKFWKKLEGTPPSNNQISDVVLALWRKNMIMADCGRVETPH